MAKKGKKSTPFKIKLKKSTIFSILSLGLFFISLITIFSFLRQGPILIQLNEILFQFFGPVSFFLPLVFFFGGILFSKIKTPLKEINVFLGGLIIFLSLLGLFQAGEVGFWFWSQVAFLITGVGAFLIFLGGSLIGLVVLFNTSLEQIVKSVFNVLTLIKNHIFGFKKKKPPLFVADKKDEGGLEKDEPLLRVEERAPEENLIIPPAAKSRVWEYPPLDLLRGDLGGEADRGDIRINADIIEKTLDSFGITARVKEVNRGPAVTQYALEVALGTKLSKITALSNDLALSLAAPTGQIRIEAPIPGRSLVGIEVPNKSLAIVSLREMFNSKAMKRIDSKIAVPLGLDVSGAPRVTEIGRMPHVLIAGQTGSGKSVLLNSWISTILFRTKPEEVKLILVDPKRVELTRYNSIPHLLTPVIVEPEKVVSALKWAIKEMDRRYRIFAEKGVRNLEIYNQTFSNGEEKMPYILIIIDELADIMLFAPAEVEDNICRIAQMARATGIHLILTTQRPSVDVLTGLIKANIPCRISFAVSSMTDSRVILDTPGAEKLLGHGDMLYIPPDQAKPARIQGPLITDAEVNKLIDFLKKQAKAEYQEEVFDQPVSLSPRTVMVNGEERDELFDQAADLVRAAKKASASLLQRKLKIGYARAARILDQLEGSRIVGPAEGSKPRQVIG